jgi:nucleotide-binding universal stress UspA family protein
MKAIVVGYDASTTALKAVREAAGLARSTGAVLHVVAAVDDSAVRQGMITDSEQSAANAHAVAANEHLLTADSGEGGIADLLGGAEARSTVMTGEPGRCVLEYVADVEADLIVVGNRRVQGLERLLGSVAVNILRHAPCSVYVAHTNS